MVHADSLLARPAAVVDAFQPASGPPPQKLLPFMRWSVTGTGPVLILAAALSAVVGTLDIVSALLLGHIIDTALASDTATFMAENTALLIGTALFFVVLRPVTFGAAALSNGVIIQPNVNPMVLQRLHRWTLGQAVTFFDNDFAGRIAQKQMQTARAMTDTVSEVINALVLSLSSIVGAALLLGAIDLRISAALLLWLVAYLALVTWYLPRIRERSKARAHARSSVSGQIVDTISNIKTVKLFASAQHEDHAALKSMDVFRDRAISFGTLSTRFRTLLMALAGLLPVMLIGGSLVLWTQGVATPGDIAAAGAVAIRIAQMTGWVSFTLMGIYANIGEIEDGMRTLTAPQTLTDAPRAAALPRVAGRLSFDDVRFTYGRGRVGGGLHGVSLNIEPGEKIGLVGASGAGKSTLVSLLLRLYDPERGSVRIDGHDVREIQQESLRTQISMVTQDTAMFNRSARDNIRYGSPHADEAQLIRAAEQAEAHEFVLGLKDYAGREGYDAHLGERGVRLSGGQRQRIALARAILKDAPILILDEATSALDSEVEAKIQAALERAMLGKTVLAIAHRLSTIAHMDRIIVLEDGKIAEQGTHSDLLALGGRYSAFWQRQSGGFIGLEAAE